MTVSIALFAGLMLTRVFRRLGLNFPDVTAFLIAGLLIGPYGLGQVGLRGLGFVSMKDVEAVSAHIIGSTTGSFLKAAADVNADKEINVADIVGIVGIIKAKS